MNLLPSRTSTAVEDGQFQVVKLDDHIVYPHANERGQEVLGGGDQHTLTHEAGGIADLRYIAARGGDLEIIQIGAAKDDSRTGRRR
jgi:hypothetical protein